jgi:hypothetical protein
VAIIVAGERERERERERFVLSLRELGKILLPVEARLLLKLNFFRKIVPTIQQLAWLYHFDPTSSKMCKLIYGFIKCVGIRSHVSHANVFCQHGR